MNDEAKAPDAAPWQAMPGTEAPVSASIKAYHERSGASHVLWTFRGGAGPAGVATVLDNLFGLLEAGWTTSPPGEPELEAGEHVESCEGWVLGETSNGKPVVWLYGHEHLKWRLVNVWEEQIASLPVKLDGVEAWPTNQAPERDVAVSKGYLHPCNFDIVMDEHEQGGKKHKRFVRVVGAAKEGGAGEKTETPEDQDAARRQGYLHRIKERLQRSVSAERFAGHADFLAWINETLSTQYTTARGVIAAITDDDLDTLNAACSELVKAHMVPQTGDEEIPF